MSTNLRCKLCPKWPQYKERTAYLTLVHYFQPYTELVGSRIRVVLSLGLFSFTLTTRLGNHFSASRQRWPKCRAGQINGVGGFSYVSIWEISERKRVPVGICVRAGNGMT